MTQTRLVAYALAVLALCPFAPEASARTLPACEIASPPADCRDLWALQVELVVPPGTGIPVADAGCALEAHEDVLRVVRAAHAAKPPRVSEYAGPLDAVVAGPLDERLRARGVSAAQAFAPYMREGVACATVAGVIPVRSFVMGFRLLAADDKAGGDFQECVAGTACPIGQSGFTAGPTEQRNGEIQVVAVPFTNISPEHTRRARLIVFYKMLAGETPKSELTPPASARATRRVPLEGASNFRDLGGYSTADGRHVKWGMLYRSDALDSLTPTDWKTLEALDIATITDFRADREIQRRPDRLSPQLEARRRRVPLDYLPKAAPGSAGVVAPPPAVSTLSEEEMLADVDRMLLSVYPRFVRETRAEYGGWLKSLLDGPAQSPHVFHCTGGADRAGFAAAIALLALGVPREQVMQDYLLTNQYLYSPEGRALLDRRTDGKLPPGVQVDARYLDAALDATIADYGSFDAYLRDGLGVDAATLDQLRRKFLE